MWIDWDKIEKLNEKLRQSLSQENQVRLANEHLNKKWLPEMFEVKHWFWVMRDIEEVFEAEYSKHYNCEENF